MTVRRSVLAVMLVPIIASAAHKLYEVMPHKNYIGQTQPDGEISQTFINVVDELTEVHIWVGDGIGHRAMNDE